MKVILKINRILKRKDDISTIKWLDVKEKINRIKKKQEIFFDEDEIGIPINEEDLLKIKKKLLELNKLLRTKYKIEEAAYTEQQIKECAEKRCEYIVEEQ